MRRSSVSLDDVASLDTLSHAFWRAARGKRERPEVQRLRADLLAELARLGEEIRAGTVRVGELQAFRIRDPKPRIIHAPSFRERVLHHALMAHVGPVLDRTLVDDTFACREGKGTLAAVLRAQHHARRHPWYVKMDVRAYFASIDHAVLRAMLRRKLRDRGVLALCDRIIDSHHASPGRGLPIGSLTSQWFANVYLGPLDRLLLERLRVRGAVRYMDDEVAWCGTKHEAKAVLAAVVEFVGTELRLELRPPQIQRSAQGLSFLGFRVLPHTLGLSRRRRRRDTRARQRLELAYRAGTIDARALQAGYDAVLAITAHADARGFRAAELRLRPPLDA